jgi:hypothetical protein
MIRVLATPGLVVAGERGQVDPLVVLDLQQLQLQLLEKIILHLSINELQHINMVCAICSSTGWDEAALVGLGHVVGPVEHLDHDDRLWRDGGVLHDLLDLF